MLKAKELQARIASLIGQELTKDNLEKAVLFDMPKAQGKSNVYFDGIHSTSDSKWTTVVLSGAEPVRIGLEEKNGKYFVKAL